MFEYLVHIVNSVSGWVVTQVHVTADTDDEAIDKAFVKFGLPKPDVNDAIKAIPQIIGDAAVDDAKEAVATVEKDVVAEPAVPVETDAEKAAAAFIAQLPADVLAAIKAKA